MHDYVYFKTVWKRGKKKTVVIPIQEEGRMKRIIKFFTRLINRIQKEETQRTQTKSRYERRGHKDWRKI